jgi:hypothetical protein
VTGAKLKQVNPASTFIRAVLPVWSPIVTILSVATSLLAAVGQGSARPHRAYQAIRALQARSFVAEDAAARVSTYHGARVSGARPHPSDASTRWAL